MSSKTVFKAEVEGASPKFRISADVLEIRRLIAKAGDQEAPVTLQLKSAKTQDSAAGEAAEEAEAKIKTRLLGYSESQKTFRLAPAPELSEEWLKENEGAECLLLVFLPGQFVLGIQGSWKAADENGLVFDYPSRVFKLQRRQEARLPIRSAYALEVEFISPEGRGRLKKRLHDLSTQGLSFEVLSSREVTFFKDGLILKQVALMIQGREIRVDVEIRNRVPLGKKGLATAGFKIGGRFLNMKSEDEQFISEFVITRLVQLSI